MAVTVITGTSSGIGLATALHFARRGHRVYATMRSLDRAMALREVAAAERLALTVHRLDWANEASVQGTIGEIEAQAGRIDVLVNNGAIVHFSPVEHATDARAREVFETNLFGALRTIRAVLPGMRARRSGAIVNISSIGGRIAPMCTGLYTMAKHALEAASEMLAQEVRPYGIRVAVIEPGFFATPMLDRATSTLCRDPETPYADAERRVSLWFALAKQTAADPRRVAEAIEEAVTTPEPKLRYPVGLDAPVYIGGRARISDEEWVDLGREMTDEKFFQEFAARFPMPVQATA
jgi:NAD(P)-dependent dehydrogenase (short-subunit alcohol dehydrogenase family)